MQRGQHHPKSTAKNSHLLLKRTQIEAHFTVHGVVETLVFLVLPLILHDLHVHLAGNKSLGGLVTRQAVQSVHEKVNFGVSIAIGDSCAALDTKSGDNKREQRDSLCYTAAGSKMRGASRSKSAYKHRLS